MLTRARLHCWLLGCGPWENYSEHVDRVTHAAQGEAALRASVRCVRCHGVVAGVVRVPRQWVARYHWGGMEQAWDAVQVQVGQQQRPAWTRAWLWLMLKVRGWGVSGNAR